MKHIAVIAGYEYRFIEMFSSVEDSSQFVLCANPDGKSLSAQWIFGSVTPRQQLQNRLPPLTPVVPRRKRSHSFSLCSGDGKTSMQNATTT